MLPKPIILSPFNFILGREVKTVKNSLWFKVCLYLFTQCILIYYTYITHIICPIFFHKFLHILNYISSSKSCFLSLTFFILITTLMIIFSINLEKNIIIFYIIYNSLISEVELHYNVVNVYPYYHG